MNTDIKTRFEQRWGTSKSIEPYITGYHFAKFELPEFEVSNVAPGERANLLASMLLSVDLPKITVVKSLNDFGKESFKLQKTNLVMKFLEGNSTPIHNIMSRWFYKVIENKPDNHRFLGDVYYWTTAPDGKTLEYYSYIENIYPTSDGDFNFSMDISIYETLPYEVEFEFEKTDKTKHIKTKIKKFIAEYVGEWKCHERPPWIEIDEGDKNE